MLENTASKMVAEEGIYFEHDVDEQSCAEGKHYSLYKQLAKSKKHFKRMF